MTGRSAPGTEPGPLRLCVIGSSHIAALKVASLTRVADDVELLIRGRAHKLFGTIVADGDGIRVDCPPQQADAVGAMWDPLGSVVRYDAHDVFAVYGVLSVEAALCAATLQEAHRGYSDGYVRAGIAAGFIDNPAAILAADIAAASAKPTFVVAAPLLARPPHWTRNARATPGPRSWARAVELAGDHFAERGLSFLAQPAETLQSWSQTDPGFARGLDDLGKMAVLEADLRHMNSTYGAILLEALIAAARLAHADAAALTPGARDDRVATGRIAAQ